MNSEGTCSPEGHDLDCSIKLGEFKEKGIVLHAGSLSIETAVISVPDQRSFRKKFIYAYIYPQFK